MKVFKYIALSLCAVLLILGIAGFFLPTTQHLEREITIEAPASSVFEYLNDFHKFNEWSPWAKFDLATQYDYSGPETGVGAKVNWSSENQHVGSGSQEILESVPNKFVKTALDFGAGSPANASFSLSEAAGQTTLVWGFDTELDTIVSRYFGLMLDKWVGTSYEEGLANLKELLESK